jgi:peptidoglycan hydrolase-like protein with peptidoglycan-binding domain
MECSNIMEAALAQPNFANRLKKGSREEELVTDLQRVLFELGFKKELKWEQYNADGDYGNATATAVKAFAAKNGIHTDGMQVSKELAKVILQRHDFLPEMYVLWEIHQSDLRTRKYISKGTKMSISAVQVLLNTLGYGAELHFARFGADGLYGNNTRNAIIKYAADNGVQSDGDWLTRPLIDLMLRDINKFYGKDWSALALQNLPHRGSPLILYQGSRFQGKPCRADIEFLPKLKKINKHAEDSNVFIHVTSSFRTTTNVNGAIVPPATFSNHLAGHGIDMNLVYDNGKWANSTVLRNYPNVPGPVRQFLKAIIDDPELRWGGLFNTKDPVHIDDHLNKDLTKWRKRYDAMQRAVQLG